jgi:transposase
MRDNVAMPPITRERLAALPPEIRAVVQALIDHYEGQLGLLRAENEVLRSELAQAQKNSRNSSKPPSTEHPHAKPLPPTKPTSQRPRGGQPGHEKHERALIPAEECSAIYDHRPKKCRGCGGRLLGTDPVPLRHQVWELPEIQPLVTEHRRHRLMCSCCGTVTCGELPAGLGLGQAGPRLVAFVALLMGAMRQSKRKSAWFLENILNIPCSPGWIVKLQNQATVALRPTYDDLVLRLPDQDRLNIDETPHKQGPLKTWLWAFVATTFTVFALRLTRKADELYAHVGEEFPGVVGCDRAKMYVRLRHLQWCWAHLIRDFQALIDSGDGQAKRLGHDLKREVDAMFGLWNRVRDGTLTRRGFRILMKPIRQSVEALLLRGAFSGNGLFAGMCDELWRGRRHLWTFVDVEGVGPTNNDAERALRHAVIWRKLSFGTQSDAGSRFVETMLTIIETCRQQRRNAFDYIATTVAAHFTGNPPPIILSGA